MAQQALALGGAALGAWIGGPWGARIGFAVGTAAGALLFPEKSPKPQKADTTVQSASYGTPIAVLAGTDRTAGTLIWVKDNERQARKVEQGGKGLGALGGSTTTFEYFASFAVLIGKGEIDGIRKIWCDTKLVHDKSAAALQDALYNGDTYVTNLHAIDTNLRIYLGTDDQLPDPAIQADRSVANTTAFRGLAYIVFDELPLANFANRIPNISVEYVKDGTLSYISTTPVTGIQGLNIALDPYGPYLWHARLGPNIAKFNTLTQQVELNINVEDQLDSNGAAIAIFSAGATPDEFGNIYVAGLGVDCYKFNALTLTYIAHTDAWGSDNVGRWIYNSYNAGTVRWLSGLNEHGNLRVINPVTFQGAVRSFDVGTSDFHDMTPDEEFWCVDGNNLFQVSMAATPDIDASAPNGQYWTHTLSLVSTTNLSATFGGTLDRVKWFQDESVLLLAGGGTIAKFDPATLTITATATGVGEYDASEFIRGPVNGKLWGLSGQTFVEFDVPSMTVTRSFARTLWSGINTRDGVAYDPWSDSLIARPQVISNDDFSILFLPRIDPLDVDRADVITQYSEEVGLTASQINVAGVTTTVKGNTVRRQTTGRDALEPILQVGFVEATDYDRKVNFIQLGQSPTLTVSEDDLGARLEDRTGETQNLIETLEQEIRLPERILLRYPDRDAQYDPGAQSARRSRLAVTTREQITVDTSEVLDSDGGRQCVEKLLYSAWQERTHLRFSLLPKHGKLVPTDVVNLTRGNVSYKVRLQKIDIGPYLECEGVPQEPATYVSTITGVPTSIPEEVLRILSNTTLFLIDSNLIRDEDDNHQHYVGLTPSIPDGLWPGAQIFKSSDAISYSPSVSFTTAIDWGVAEGALADHHSTTTDRYNTLTVSMVRDSAGLSSCTELEMLNGSNAFLLESIDDDGNIDWELIQASTITSLGSGRYTLSVMLRGQRGTEQATGNHRAGDRLIVLSATTMQRIGESSEVGLTRYYKATTFGKVFDPTGAVSFSNTARGRECYAPAHVDGTRSGSGDLTITWVRRSRIGGESDWGDAITDVPLGEDSEEYKVEVYNGATLVRTISSLTSETTTYTAAQQVTDFGSTQSSVAVRVYQVSEDNAAGRAAAATI